VERYANVYGKTCWSRKRMKELKIKASATSTKVKKEQNRKICSRNTKVKDKKYAIQKEAQEIQGMMMLSACD